MINQKTNRKADILIRKTLAVILVGVFLFTNTLSWAKEEGLFSTAIENELSSSRPVDNNKLAPGSRLNSDEFKTSLTVAAICKHIEDDGSLDDKSYPNDVLARLGAEKNPNIIVLPYEIIIEIPNESFAIRYFDPTKANVVTPYSDILKLQTKIISPRLNRQIIHRIKALSSSMQKEVASGVVKVPQLSLESAYQKLDDIKPILEEVFAPFLKQIPGSKLVVTKGSSIPVFVSMMGGDPEFESLDSLKCSIETEKGAVCQIFLYDGRSIGVNALCLGRLFIRDLSAEGAVVTYSNITSNFVEQEAKQGLKKLKEILQKVLADKDHTIDLENEKILLTLAMASAGLTESQIIEACNLHSPGLTEKISESKIVSALSAVKRKFYPSQKFPSIAKDPQAFLQTYQNIVALAKRMKYSKITALISFPDGFQNYFLYTRFGFKVDFNQEDQKTYFAEIEKAFRANRKDGMSLKDAVWDMSSRFGHKIIPMSLYLKPENGEKNIVAFYEAVDATLTHIRSVSRRLRELKTINYFEDNRINLLIQNIGNVFKDKFITRKQLYIAYWVSHLLNLLESMEKNGPNVENISRLNRLIDIGNLISKMPDKYFRLLSDQQIANIIDAIADYLNIKFEKPMLIESIKKITQKDDLFAEKLLGSILLLEDEIRSKVTYHYVQNGERAFNIEAKRSNGGQLKGFFEKDGIHTFTMKDYEGFITTFMIPRELYQEIKKYPANTKITFHVGNPDEQYVQRLLKDGFKLHSFRKGEHEKQYRNRSLYYRKGDRDGQVEIVFINIVDFGNLTHLIHFYLSMGIGSIEIVDHMPDYNQMLNSLVDKAPTGHGAEIVGVAAGFAMGTYTPERLTLFYDDFNNPDVYNDFTSPYLFRVIKCDQKGKTLAGFNITDGDLAAYSTRVILERFPKATSFVSCGSAGFLSDEVYSDDKDQVLPGDIFIPTAVANNSFEVPVVNQYQEEIIAVLEENKISYQVIDMTGKEARVVKERSFENSTVPIKVVLGKLFTVDSFLDETLAGTKKLRERNFRCVDMEAAQIVNAAQSLRPDIKLFLGYLITDIPGFLNFENHQNSIYGLKAKIEQKLALSRKVFSLAAQRILNAKTKAVSDGSLSKNIIANTVCETANEECDQALKAKIDVFYQDIGSYEKANKALLAKEKIDGKTAGILQKIKAHIEEKIPGLRERNIQILFAIPENNKKLWWVKHPKTGEWLYASGHFDRKRSRIYISIPLIFSQDSPEQIALSIARHYYNHMIGKTLIEDEGVAMVRATAHEEMPEMITDETLIDQRSDFGRVTTSSRRLAHSDIYILNELLPQITTSKLIVDIGTGYPPVTIIELADKLNMTYPSMQVMGLEIRNPACVVETKTADKGIARILFDDKGEIIAIDYSEVELVPDIRDIPEDEKQGYLSLRENLIKKGDGKDYHDEQGNAAVFNPMSKFVKGHSNLSITHGDFRKTRLERKAAVVRAFNILTYYENTIDEEIARIIDNFVEEGGFLIVGSSMSRRSLTEEYITYRKLHGKSAPLEFAFTVAVLPETNTFAYGCGLVNFSELRFGKRLRDDMERIKDAIKKLGPIVLMNPRQLKQEIVNRLSMMGYKARLNKAGAIALSYKENQAGMRLEQLQLFRESDPGQSLGVSGTDTSPVVKIQNRYLDDNKKLLEKIYQRNQAALVRIPTEAIESIGADNIKNFLATFQEAPSGYVELYYMSGTGEVSESVYQRYGLQKKPLPIDFKRTRENTVTLFPALKGEEIDQSIIVSRLGSVNITPENTILSPIGLQHDPAGLIRATMLGLKIMDIARQAREGKTIDKDAITVDILTQLRDVLNPDDFKNFDLTPDDIISLATGNINNILTALKKLVKLLPITPINAEELRQIYEHAKAVIIAA